MKNGVCPDSIGAGSLRVSFFLANEEGQGMVERLFSTLLASLGRRMATTGKMSALMRSTSFWTGRSTASGSMTASGSC